MHLAMILSSYYKTFSVLSLLLVTYGEKTLPWGGTSYPSLNCTEDANCPPWGECSNNRCVCRDALSNILNVQCNNETLQLSVSKCHCVTYDNKSEEVFEGNCIENCVNAYGDYMPLPRKTFELNKFMCEERWNRTGRLCGKCLPGHSPLAYSYSMRCVECPEGNKNIWKYILVAFGPLTVFYFVVLALKINATSSHLHGYVIFSQIVSTPTFYRNIVEYVQIHQHYKPINGLAVMYSLWNLDFFRGLYPDICLDVSTLTALTLDYAVAIYPLLLTVVSYFLIQLYARNVRIVVILWKPFHHVLTLLRRNWDSRTTVIDAYATFYILSYTKILCVSVDLLIPVRAHSLNDGSVRWVLYYDGTLDYFGREHLPYAFLAILFSALVTAPTILLLLFYQQKCFQRLLTCLKIHSQLLHALTDSFQGCCKNGTEPGTRDCRWFAAVHFIGRIVLLLTYSMTLDKHVYPYLTIVIVSIIVIMTIVQPYKTHLSKYAKLDITFWGFLAVFYAAIESRGPNHIQAAGTLIAGVLPLLYMFCISAYWILSRMRKIKDFICQIQARRRGYLNIEETLPDRLVNPEHYQERDLQGLPNDVTRHSNDTY